MRGTRHPHTLESIPGGAGGTRHTLMRMAQLINSNHGKLSPLVRETAANIVRSCPPKKLLCEIIKIHRFVRDEIRYVRDINGVETICTPEKILDFECGDCDDKSILTSALLESIGFKTRLVAVGPMLNRFTHVLVEVLLRGRWIPLETTEPVKVGWYPKKLPHRMVQNI